MAYTQDEKSTGLELLTWAQLANGDIITVGDASDSGRLKGVLKSELQTQLDGKVDENSAITGATKTKVTYDAKGLVTSGADATTADIADSTNKRYVTDANLTVISNTSGANTGDETTSSIKTKLGITTLSGSNTGDQNLAPYLLSSTAASTYEPLKGADDNFVTDAEKVVIGNTSGTNSGDNAPNSLYSGLVSNATHTGEVTGATALTVDKTAITNKTAATAVGTDYVLISDTSDSGNLKKALVSDFTGGGGGSAAREVISATLSGTQTNYSISGVSTDISVTTELRVAFTSGSFIWQSIDTTSWEDGKPLTFVNNTVSDASGARFILFENQEGASGTQFRYPFNGVPPIIMPGDFITFRLNTTDGFLDFVSSSCYGANAESGFSVYSDFVGGPSIASGGAANGLGPFAGIQGNGSCAYTSSFQNSPINPFGILDLSTHTNSTGAFFVGSSNASMMRGGMGCAMFLVRGTPLTALSDGTNTYTIIAGFNDAQFGAPVDAVGWKYDQSAATVWRTSTISNSSETVNDQTGFTVSITTMPYLGVFCNGNWTNIEFFYSVDGQTWVIGNTHTTNIPTGSSRTFGFGTKILKSAGTTARLMSLDLMGVRTMHIRG